MCVEQRDSRTKELNVAPEKPVDADRSGLDLHHIKRGLAPPTTDRLERVEQALRVDKPVVNLLIQTHCTDHTAVVVS